jgi:ArsR family transcriptional regulator, cadmium/lead-responsive transcriptional repressor
VADRDRRDSPPSTTRPASPLSSAKPDEWSQRRGTDDEHGCGAVDEAAALTAATCLFRSLADPTRLAIVRHLMLGPHRVVDLTRHLAGPSQSSVSAALACLRDCGLAESQPRGRASLWSLTTSPELLELLSAAEKVLAATGDAVAVCPVFGEAAHR